MARDLMSVNVFPKPLNAFSTGDKKADEAIAKLQTWVLSPASPAATPGGDEYDATTKAASKVAPDKLLALLDDAACDTGHCHWDDDAIAKMGTADKRAFNKHYEAVGLAQKTREGYLAWLMSAVLPTGLTRREVPEDFTDQIFQACQIKPIATLSLPSPSNQHVTKTMKRDEVERYEEDFADTPALPQFLGYRDHGYDAEEPATAELLLQLTGDSQSDMQLATVITCRSSSTVPSCALETSRKCGRTSATS